MSTEHIWAQEHIDTYLTRGLSGEERARFESHTGACAECTATLHEAKQTDRELKGLFAAARPKPGLEDRIIRQIRTAPTKKIKFNPTAWKIGTGIAAAGLIGLLGYVSSMRMSKEALIMASVEAPPADQSLFGDRDLSETVFREDKTHGPATPAEIAGAVGDNLLARADNYVNDSDAQRGLRLQDGTADIPTMALKPILSNRNESSEREEFQPQKGETNDLVLDKPFKGTFVLDGIGGGSGSGGGKTEGGSISKPATSSVYRDESTIHLAKPADAEYFRPGAEAESKLKDGLAKQKEELTIDAKKPPEKSNERNQREVKMGQQEKPQQEPPAMQRKVIRNGEMEFEVEGFDSAYMQISKIVTEEGGFIASTNSDKLPNGKVRGTVTIRVSPERLDTLVLKLRALGDLKSQQLRSQDITKQYTDLESALRASRAMEERLIKIIKDGNGAMKDILEAEKQLGVYREKIEQLEGEIRYYNNLVSLSTLAITMYEKDIKNAYAAKEIETVTMGIEAEDVKKAYDEALKEIADRKGRITKSELKKHDADQFQAVIVCEIAPEASGPLRDRLSQLGKVSRLDVDRSQTTEGGTGRPEGVRLERKDSRFEISLYNIANISPRETVHLAIACADVEEAYKAILARIGKANGRVRTSNLNRERADQTNGTIDFDIRSDEAEAVLIDVRGAGEVTRLISTENPDTNNVTKAKRGFKVTLFGLSQVNPREVTTMRLAAKSVPDAYRIIQTMVQESKGRVTLSILNENDRENIAGRLTFQIGREKVAELEKVLAGLGDIYSRNLQRAGENEAVVDSKVGFDMAIVNVAGLPPRETTKIAIEVVNVDRSFGQIKSLALNSGGRIVDEQFVRRSDGQVVGYVVIEIPLSHGNAILTQIEDAAEVVRLRETAKNAQVPDGPLAKARLNVTVSTVPPMGGGKGIGTTIHDGLSKSIEGLVWSLQFVVIGLSFIIPFGLIAWPAWWLIRRKRSKDATPAEPPVKQ